jgi:hypothetical protein
MNSHCVFSTSNSISGFFFVEDNIFLVILINLGYELELNKIHLNNLCRF